MKLSDKRDLGDFHLGNVAKELTDLSSRNIALRTFYHEGLSEFQSKLSSDESNN